MSNLRFENLNDELHIQLFSKSDLHDLSNFMFNTKPASNEILRWISVFKEEDLIGSYWIESRNDKMFLGLFVLSQFRGQSHGKLILKEILSVAKQSGIKEIFLNVRENNVNAITLYEKLGFLKTKNFVNRRGTSSIEFKFELQ